MRSPRWACSWCWLEASSSRARPVSPPRRWIATSPRPTPTPDRKRAEFGTHERSGVEVRGLLRTASMKRAYLVFALLASALIPACSQAGGSATDEPEGDGEVSAL